MHYSSILMRVYPANSSAGKLVILGAGSGSPLVCRLRPPKVVETEPQQLSVLALTSRFRGDHHCSARMFTTSGARNHRTDGAFVGSVQCQNAVFGRNADWDRPSVWQQHSCRCMNPALSPPGHIPTRRRPALRLAHFSNQPEASLRTNPAVSSAASTFMRSKYKRAECDA